MGILITVTTHTKIRSHIKNPSFDGYFDNCLQSIPKLGHTLKIHHLMGILVTATTHTKIRSHIKNPSFDGYFDNR
jgi:hypothetical protein